ncbi:TIGR04197 family type VII secretion effector [Pueribacillus sp. YX66]|uniref:TIGR04197 family type VII secretion effector n=1 Tax=Pueribacillus sp. YX66 TaxID=3229242 RepID=UPI00358D0A5E
MSKEIKLNTELFRSNVKSLRSSLDGLYVSMGRNKSFNMTTINPFKNDLENVMRALELLEKYKALLNADINKLQKTGEEMIEQDERISHYTGSLGGYERRRI